MGDGADIVNARSLSALQGRLFDRYWAAGWWTGERLVDRFERHVSSDPNTVAVIDDQGQRLSRSELWVAAGLSAQELAGLEGPILMLLPNTAYAVVTFLGTLRASLVPATLPATTGIQAIATAASSVGATAIVAPSDSVSPVVDGAAVLVGHPVRVGVAAGPGGLDWRDGGSSDERPVLETTATHLMFTSGTTQTPKVVEHDDNTLGVINEMCIERFALADDPIFMAAPLGHSVGAVHGLRLSLYSGAPLILQSRWDARSAVEMIEGHRCAFTAAPVTFLSDLLTVVPEMNGGQLSELQTFLCGGAPVPPETIRRAREAFPSTFITPAWGMTEGGITTCVPESTVGQTESTVGLPLPGLELRILDADGGVVEAGESGELAMRGPGVFLGYAGQPELYGSLVDADGYFRTGDQAVLDSDGYLKITGRLKDLIIRGGVNISPGPIEDVLMEHPGIAEVVVIGYPDERLGERICAVLVPSEGAPSELGLLAYCRDKGLPRRQWPELMAVWDELPRNAGGKVQKRVVRDLLVNESKEQDNVVALGRE